MGAIVCFENRRKSSHPLQYPLQCFFEGLCEHAK